MQRKKYKLMITEMAEKGKYSLDPIGKCLREYYAVNGDPKKDIDLCLRDSKTYSAFQRNEDISEQFNDRKARTAWLQWTEDFSKNTPSKKIEILVDVKGGVFKECESGRFGCLADVKNCLHYGNLNNISESKVEKPWYEIDQIPTAETELESFKASYENEPETEQEAIILARRGQGRFRTALIELWASKCSVTKSRVLRLLRASHIKPWRASTNEERLNPYNGLLLLPNLDAAFDIGLISFADNGRILVSSTLTAEEARRIGIKRNLKLFRVFNENMPFLAVHRKLHNFDTE